MVRIFAAILAWSLVACSPNGESGDAGVRDGDAGREDGVADAGEVPDSPGDGYVPTDVDGDTISDQHEMGVDTDGDSAADMYDADSDNDTVPDSVEAGDDDLTTYPVDSDRDGIPDFRDPDSDDDGLSDAEEAALGTGRTDADSDDDGASDLVEHAAGTDPLVASDNPRSRGDFVFVVPFEEDPVPPEDTLVFGTNIQMADVYFILDRSASMRNELANLATSLQTAIVPGVGAAIPDVWFGVGLLDQCPNAAACTTSGTPIWIKNLQSLAEDPALTATALGTVIDTCNGAKEPYVSAVWLLANGDPTVWGWLPARIPARTCSDASAIGYPCFRPGAVPIVVMFGDEDVYTQSYGAGCDPADGNAPSLEQAVAEMNRIHARFIGIDSGNSAEGFTDVATGTGSVDAAGRPLVFTINADGTGLDIRVVDAIEALASQVPIDISADAVDVAEGPGDTVDATVFIDRVVPNEAGGVADPRDAGRVCVALPAEDRSSDTVPDVFPDVLPGTIVCFDIEAARNETIPPTAEPQLYRAQIRVIGEGITVLDTRDVYFLVPPVIEITLG
jgi:hypothetical protein